ncbi:MAG TPA: glycosyltransferase [Acidimicrobiales bacterium]|nr:glycosyltransferase [Acidimicrobiales bacterium]
MATTVVVVSHRVHRWLGPCLASVRHQAGEMIVVDNGSPGGEVGDAARAEGARVVRLPANAGFPAGVNAGVAAATGDVVALLNDDAMADPGWLPSAEAVLGADPTVAVVAPKLVFALPFAEMRFDDQPRRVGADPRPLGRPLRAATVGGVDVLERLAGPGVHRIEHGTLDGVEGRWRWTAGRAAVYVPLGSEADAGDVLVDGRPAPVVGVVHLINNAGSYLSAAGFGGDHGYLAPDDGRFDTAAERFGACGGAMVTTARVWERVGPFAAAFFAYYEDVDWCWRARLAGLRAWYEPAGVVRHVGGVTSGGPLAQQVRGLAARNRLLCLARNAPLPVAAAQLRTAGRVDPPLRSWPDLARRLPAALAQRTGRRRVSPRQVWDRWAGADETW